MFLVARRNFIIHRDTLAEIEAVIPPAKLLEFKEFNAKEDGKKYRLSAYVKGSVYF